MDKEGLREGRERLVYASTIRIGEGRGREGI